MTKSWGRWAGLGTWTLATVLLCSTICSTTLASSAADKATARELAADGIKKFNAGNPKAALKSLQKAQALYDAPIHLLYIARAHEQLGQLIEAAESYRSLARVQLNDDAPQVFLDAQRDGRKELAELEPRIARLTIEIEPEDLQGLEVKVDGQPINTAVLSVARPSNPGDHVVEVLAPGYEEASKEVQLEEGGEETLHFELEVDEDYRPDDEPSPAGTGSESSPTNWRDSGPASLLIGLRMGGYQPLGNLEKDVPMEDYYRIGGYGRFQVGMRFLRYAMAKLYMGGGLLSTGSAQRDYGYDLFNQYEATSSALTGDVGVSIGVTSNPRRLGGYGEVGFSFLHGYLWQSRVSGPGDVDCTTGAAHAGLGGRAEAGVNVPLHRYVTLVPFVDFSLGSLSRRSTDYDCPSGNVDGVTWPPPPEPDTRDMESAVQYQLFFGLGADFSFGDQWFD